MSAYYKDSIVAIASPMQNGAIGVIRLSGCHVAALLQKMFRTAAMQSVANLQPRHLYYGKLLDKAGQELDQVTAVYMPGPNSFTGEDVIELFCHGNLILLKNIVRAILAFDSEFEIRAADAGEFTRRAYLNGKMDLTQAEAVHELIVADNDSALKASLSNLDGRLKSHIESLKEDLVTTLALVEASFEFSEEDIQTYDIDEVIIRINNTLLHMEQLHACFATSKLYDHGVAITLVGSPNVGKSSILNKLLVEERAIVTDVAGTTRDVVDGSKVIDGLRFVFRDTAGLRDTTDEIESEGIRRSQEWIDKSDIVLWIAEDANEFSDDGFLKLNSSESQKPVVIRLLNKCDLLFSSSIPSGDEAAKMKKDFNVDFLISALSGHGFEELEAELVNSVQNKINVQNYVHINERQFHKVNQCIPLLTNVKVMHEQNTLNDEFLAEELRAIILNLDEITGGIHHEDVLGEIFQRFCIGK
jgi:tRNA modification GTPase